MKAIHRFVLINIEKLTQYLNPIFDMFIRLSISNIINKDKDFDPTIVASTDTN